MARRPLDQLGELQRAVLEAVWRLEPVTVQGVVDALQGSRRPAYTTILTTLQKLEKLGWVKHRREGRAYLYSATRSRRHAGTSSVRGLIERVFHGDPHLLMESLLEEESLTREDLDRLRKLIDAKRKETGDD